MSQYLFKLLKVLPIKKRTLFFLLLLFLATSIIEVFGIGIIGPFIAMANSPEIVHQNFWLESAFEYSRLDRETQFIGLVGIFVIIIFVIKSIFGWLTQVHILKFSNFQQAELASKLVSSYLNAPYTFHLQNNSSYVINIVLQLINTLAGGILIPLLTTTSNLIIASFIICLLCFTNLSIIVVFLIVLMPLAFLYNYFKFKLEKWGKEGLVARQEMIESINHGLGGIKETKIIGCESYFENQIYQKSHKLSELSNKFFAFQFLPRYVVETLMLSTVIGIISVFLILNKNIEQLTSVLGIYALAAVRIIPLISHSMGGISTMRNNTHILDSVYFALKELNVTKSIKTTSNPTFASVPSKYSSDFEEEIVLNNISYDYPNASTRAISNISLTIKKGESIALIGKSGAGKTTLVDLILGLLTPQSGDIKVDGTSIYRDIRGWQNLIGYIPQSIFLIDDSLERNIAFGVPDIFIDHQKLQMSIEAAQLTDVVAKLPHGTKTQVGERGVMLSGGQRQRVGIARAIYHERDILVLDEATAALDNETESLVTQAINSLSGKKTMIFIAHRLTTIANCDRVYLLEGGKLLKSGSYQEIVMGM